MFAGRRLELRSQPGFQPARVSELRLERFFQPAALGVRLVELRLECPLPPETLAVRLVQLRLEGLFHQETLAVRFVQLRLQRVRETTMGAVRLVESGLERRPEGLGLKFAFVALAFGRLHEVAHRLLPAQHLRLAIRTVRLGQPHASRLGVLQGLLEAVAVSRRGLQARLQVEVLSFEMPEDRLVRVAIQFGLPLGGGPCRLLEFDAVPGASVLEGLVQLRTLRRQFVHARLEVVTIGGVAHRDRHRF